MSDAELAKLKDFVHSTATELGRWARERSEANYLGEALVEVNSKSGPGDFVTSIDLAVQERLEAALRAETPDFGLLGEESDLADFDDSQPVWIIDPIDGTHNFVRNYPGFCVSVGLVHEGKSVLGVIFDSATDSTYWAHRGGGAWQTTWGSAGQPGERKDRRLYVSGRDELRTAMITTGFTRESAALETHLRVFEGLNVSAAGCRVSGSACRDLSFVAAGKVDLYWQWAVRPWDVAAGIVIVEEAGGVVNLEFDGPSLARSGPLNVMAGTPLVHEEAWLLRAELIGS